MRPMLHAIWFGSLIWWPIAFAVIAWKIAERRGFQSGALVTVAPARWTVSAAAVGMAAHRPLPAGIRAAILLSMIGVPRNSPGWKTTAANSRRRTASLPSL